MAHGEAFDELSLAVYDPACALRHLHNASEDVRDRGKRPRVVEGDDIPESSTSHFDLRNPYGNQNDPFSLPSLDMPIPSHLKDFLRKSVEEYKRMFLQFDKNLMFVKNLKQQNDEGKIINSLRIKPPRLTVQDPESQVLLQESLEKLAITYRLQCQNAYIATLETQLEKLRRKLNSYSSTFASNLQEILDYMVELSLVDSPSTLWHNTISKWKKDITTEFMKIVNNFKVTHLLNAKIKQAAFSRRKTAQDEAMGEADNLPTEPSIARLIKEQVQEQVKVQINKLKNDLLKKGDDQNKKRKKKRSRKGKGKPNNNNNNNNNRRPTDSRPRPQQGGQQSRPAKPQQGGQQSRPARFQHGGHPGHQAGNRHNQHGGRSFPAFQQGNGHTGGSRPMTSTRSSAHASSYRTNQNVQTSGSGKRNARQGSRSMSAPPRHRR